MRTFLAIIVMLVLFIPVEINGQIQMTLIDGVVKTERGDFVPHASVYVTKLRQPNRILASTQCNSRGEIQY